MRTLVIAEAGVNHNGDAELAKALIKVAASAGADYVKFQLFNAKSLVRSDTPKARYQSENSETVGTQFEMLEKLEISPELLKELNEYAISQKIKFLSTAFDIESAEFLFRMGQQVFKIPSGEITNLPYLRCIGNFQKEVFLSTGMSNLLEVEEALKVLEKSGTPREKITVLHCTSAYPAPISDVNLLAMKEMEKKLNVRIGYSDHTLGIEVALAAVALGASVVEKHFTLDRKLPGPDHKASLNPKELTELVTSVRIVEKSLGSALKQITGSEKENLNLVRKSIVAKERIAKGSRFTENNLTTKRPGYGLTPMKWDSIIGTIASKDYEKDDFI
jgi:N,N'-diacetyllegionaminate synthase